MNHPAILSTGHPALDAALRIGGLPRGRIAEIGGRPNADPRGVAFDTIAAAQRADVLCCLVDLRRSIELPELSARGIDLSKLLVAQPEGPMQALEICETLARTGTVPLVVVDGADAIVPGADVPATHHGLFARLVSRAMRSLCGIVDAVGTTVLFTRVELDGDDRWRPSPGVFALRYFASVRIDVRRADEQRLACVTKHKLAEPFGRCEIGA